MFVRSTAASPTAAAAAVVFAASTALAAPPVDADGAEALERLIETELPIWVPAESPEAEIEWSGDVTVEADGDAYRLTLPDLILNLTATGDMVDVDGLTARLTPLDGGRWRVDADLGDGVLVFDEIGVAVGAIDFDSFEMSGLWDERFQMFLEMDSTISGLSMTYERDELELTVDRIEMKREMREEADGWVADEAGIIDNLVTVNSREALRMEFGRILVEGNAERIDLDLVADFSDALRDLNAGIDTGAFDALVQDGGDRGVPVGEGYFRLTVEEIVTSGAIMPSVLIVPRIQIGASIDAMDSAASSGRLVVDYTHQGIEFDPPLPEPDLTVTDADWDISLENLPAEVLWSLLMEAQGYGTGGAGTLLAMTGLGPAALDAMAEAGVVASLNQGEMTGPTVSSKSNGALLFDSAAAYGLTGGIVTDIAGLADLRAAIGNRPDLAPMMPVILALSGFGEPAVNEAGESVLRFRAQIDEAGRFLVNDTDFAALMQLFGGLGAMPQ